MDKVEIDLPENFETIKSTVLQVAIEQDLTVQFEAVHTTDCECYATWDNSSPPPNGCKTMVVISAL